MTNIIFFGSSPFSIIVLQKLLNAKPCTLTAVITSPDKPAGRHLKLTPNPVKVLAQKNNIPVYDNITPLPPLNLRGGGPQDEGDIGLVAAYGKIIPQSVLDQFHGQIYNIHPSLLPKYRGPSPLQQQILDGVVDTGITIIQLDAQMDHGPIVAVAYDKILPDDTTVTLGNRLFEMGAELFMNYLSTTPLPPPKLGGGVWQDEGGTPQDDKEATFTKKLTRQDGFLPWEEFNKLITNSKSHQYEVHYLERLFQAYFPWPGVWSLDPQGKRVKLISVNPIQVRTFLA